MLELKRTHGLDEDFLKLISFLDIELSQRYGKNQKQYDNYNLVDTIETAVIGYHKKSAVASGCFKKISEESVELKRMFVKEDNRRKGFSQVVLKELEAWAFSLGFCFMVLETGKGQPEAISLYKKMGYKIIDNYGVYIDMPNSVCMRKKLN